MSKLREWTIIKGPTNFLQENEHKIMRGYVDTDAAIHIIEKSDYDDLLERYELACVSDNAHREAYEKLLAQAESIAHSMEHASKYLISCGYERLEECEPEFQMLRDFRKQLEAWQKFKEQK